MKKQTITEPVMRLNPFSGEMQPLTALKRPRKCYTCGKSFTHYAWSPHWCPECDEKRMGHIDEQFKEIEKSFQEAPNDPF